MALDFKDISDEEWREYIWPDGAFIRVTGVGLNVSSSGGHRIQGADGIAHYIPIGWIHLRWLPKAGKPLFAF